MQYICFNEQAERSQAFRAFKPVSENVYNQYKQIEDYIRLAGCENISDDVSKLSRKVESILSIAEDMVWTWNGTEMNISTSKRIRQATMRLKQAKKLIAQRLPEHEYAGCKCDDLCRC